MAAERRDEPASRTDRPGGRRRPRDPAHGARGDRARRRRRTAFPRCWSAAMRSMRRVRWVHVSDSAGDRPAAQRRRAAAVDRIGVAGRDPTSCVASSASSSTPDCPGWCSSSARTTATCRQSWSKRLATGAWRWSSLHREVKFVSLTEAVHGRIISGADRGAARPRRGARALHRALAARCAGGLHRASARADARRSRHPREPRARDRRERGAAGARGGAVHRLGAALTGCAPRRRSATSAAPVAMTGSSFRSRRAASAGAA